MYAGRKFGGIGGPQASTAIRKRTEPLGVEPAAPDGDKATPGSVNMIKWKVKWEEYNKTKDRWTKEVSPRLFYLLFAHCTQDFRGVVQGRTEWPDILEKQDGVAMVKLLHALHHQQDE